MRVFGVQLDIRWEDKPANFARVRKLIAAAHVPPDSLIVLPEMFATGFSMNVAGIAEPEGGAVESFLADLARETRSAVLGGVVTGRPDGRGLNEAVVFAPDGRAITRYAKLHPFSFAGEDRYYAAGDEIVTFPWAGFEVAPLICYDLRFPEAYREATRRGAEVLVTIANFPASREHHWLALNVARAIENQAYVVAVNRCGDDPKLSYGGRSVILGPRGETLADAGAAEGVVSATLDRATLARYRAEFPALADMRPQLLPAPSLPAGATGKA